MSQSSAGERPGSGAVAVTGANGYVGSLVTAQLIEQGIRVVSLRRTPSATPDTSVTERRFALGEPLDPESLRGVTSIVHCAWDLSQTDPREVRRVNRIGTLRLLDAASAAGVGRVVLVSSMSAYPGTQQVYGLEKLACEEAVLASGGAAVRLGLVYGEGWGGMAGALRRLISLPVVPLMGGRSHQFTVHADDAANGLAAVALADTVPGEAVGLAHPRPVPFREVLDGFARQARVSPRFVPIPWQPVHLAMRTAERVGVTLPLRSDSLLGLVRPAAVVPGVEVWDQLGVKLRDFTL